MATDQRLIEEFRHRLGLFSFFHLGSDAKISVRKDPEGINVAICHRRVRPFEFSVSWTQLEEITADSSRFERLMLDYLTRYRT